MPKINFIVLGSLSESYWRDAAAEYKKRLTAMWQINEIQLKEHRLPQNPSDSDIAAALNEEAKRILDAIPSRSFSVALCVEGKEMSSPGLASLIDSKMNSGYAEFTFIIGSSFGLSDKVKSAADFCFSMSPLTFPHQLCRVMLYETVYRACEIIKGSKYHK